MGDLSGHTLDRSKDDFVGASENNSIWLILSVITIPLLDRLSGAIFESSPELSDSHSQGTENITSKSHFWQGKNGIFEDGSEQG